MCTNLGLHISQELSIRGSRICGIWVSILKQECEIREAHIWLKEWLGDQGISRYVMIESWQLGYGGGHDGLQSRS
jgi:hypothetical protein